MRSFRRFALARSASPACWAQTIWRPPLDAELASYIAQAAPGDIIQLSPSHPGFDLDKGLTLLGDPQGTLIHM